MTSIDFNSVEKLWKGDFNQIGEAMDTKFKDREKAKLLWSAHESAVKAKEKLIADLLISEIEDAIGFWLEEMTRKRSLSPETIRNYQNYLRDLIDRNILMIKDKQNQFYQLEQIIDLYPEICKRLEAIKNLNINEKKYRLNAIMAFTQFLEDITAKKILKIVTPLSFGLGSTDRQIAPPILNNREINTLLNEIQDINIRDYLIVNLVLKTGRNLNKILALKMSDLDMANLVILFKDKNEKLIRFNLGNKIMITLNDYINKTQTDRKNDTVFITRAGKPVYRTHFQHILDQASEKAGLGFKVTMTMIQWSEVANSLIDHQSEEKVLKEFQLQSLPKFLEVAVAGKHRK